jgi:hypothetical protein
MKKISLLFVLFFVSIGVFAQSDKEDIAMIQNMFGKAKKDIMAAGMNIPEDKKTAFWGLYDQYEEARKGLGRERIDLIKSYADKYASMDDKAADAMMKQKMKWLKNYSKMQGKYYKKMSKLVGGLNASRFFQLEDYLENNIRLSIQESIPFIGELDKTRKN